MNPASLSDTPGQIQRLEDFDPRSGSLIERALFNHRRIVLILCLIFTVVFGFQATKLQLNASFEKTIPTSHPYIVNFLSHKEDLTGLENVVRVAVVNKRGTVFDKDYLSKLAKINDEVFLLPGVDRSFMKSMVTSNVRWSAVTEDGVDGGAVIPEDYDGSERTLQQVRLNVERSGEIGQLVAADFRSSIIFVPLLDKDPQTAKKLDYRKFSEGLEEIRAKYQDEATDLHITGFAKVVGDLIAGLREVLRYFAVAIGIATGMIYWFNRDVRSTLLVMASSLVAVVWQLGALPTLGYELNPYSVLVPFLVFAIGMSHGAQKMNGIMQDIGRGVHKLVAARFTFRRLFMAGLTALLADAVGFAVLLVIDIPVIKELAVAASIGVAMLIFTNLILLPILLSYTGVSLSAAHRSLRTEHADRDSGGAAKHRLWRWLDAFTQRRAAAAAIVAAVVLAVGGVAVSTQLKIGDLDAGAPELRPDSRYNKDNAYISANYAASSDILVVMVPTEPDRCGAYGTLAKVDRLAWQIEQLTGVESTNSMAMLSKFSMVGFNEGAFKWYELIPNEGAIGAVQTRAPRELLNQGCSLLSLYVYLKDHKAETLSRVVAEVEAYAKANDTPEAKFVLAAGGAGIEAATNIVVKQAWTQMLLLVYAAVTILCFLTFRSWRAVLVAVLPLMLTSVLAEALMVKLNMGVKVATLPVIALGVGIGVDYALYILSVTLQQLRQGSSLSTAYYKALLFTGKVVLLTGFTLAVGVLTWSFSDIKFQADMGILLAFMFLWNMLGALILIPALSHFLLRKSTTAANREPQASLMKAVG
ncbi:MMPL family transporter [Ideonella azotifigens]|uniref:RND family transporter n=1 Tax=Ideonella azotifigens TaxID=513160 RepID=A0ABN1KN18_9BURK|nr:MMPL family transporter [Ideonella azotifigens]MCD2344974.1 MMPL family transporter [Ideonella azotifigens]